MRSRRSFAPSAFLSLEERIALSHVGAVADISALAKKSHTHALVVSISGTTSITVPKGIGGAETSKLTGHSRAPGIGELSLSGELKSNPSLPPANARTKGTITVTSQGGSAVLTVTGPATDLATHTPKVTILKLTVKSATGSLASFAKHHGVVDLALHSPTSHGQKGTIPGDFTARVTLK